MIRMKDFFFVFNLSLNVAGFTKPLCFCSAGEQAVEEEEVEEPEEEAADDGMYFEPRAYFLNKSVNAASY